MTGTEKLREYAENRKGTDLYDQLARIPKHSPTRLSARRLRDLAEKGDGR